MAEGLDFDSLVACYYEPLFQFALSLARDESDACDLTQQTFCIWAAKGHQLRDASKVKTWLFTTLHREFLGSRRRQTRFPHIELEFAAAELPVVPPPTVNRLDAGQALDALARLDEIYQAPVALFYCRIVPTTRLPKSSAFRLAPSNRASPAVSAGSTNCWRATPPAPNHCHPNHEPRRSQNHFAALSPRNGGCGRPGNCRGAGTGKADPELTRWLAEHSAQQETVRAGFRKITVPAGLKEQIISEQAAHEKMLFWRRRAVLAATAGVMALVALASFWFQPARMTTRLPFTGAGWWALRCVAM